MMVVVVRMSMLVCLALAVVACACVSSAAARSRAPQLSALRCVPATAKACRSGVALAVGKQVQLRGRRLGAGMRVTFRWRNGALATKLRRTKVGWAVEVPAGTALGKVAVTVRDRAGRRSNTRHITVLAAAPPALPARSAALPGALPAVMAGNGMWIWYLAKSDGGDIDAIAARARAAAIETVYVKSADGTDVWEQFTPRLVQDLHAHGLRVCGWQFVYGAKPLAEAAAAAAAAAAGADCFVIDAETRYEGRYAQAQLYMNALRAKVGPDYPLGLTSFPYVDYHPHLPYSVFLGPGGAQANLPQVYWKDIGASVDAVSARTVAHNRIYGVPIAPLGQAYGNPGPAALQRFRAIWAGYGAAGLSWWSWQSSGDATWAALMQPPPAPVVLADPGWPALRRGSTGDQVIWLQQHLAAVDPAVAVDGTFTAATDTALRAFQTTRGLPATAVTDAATWQALLTVAPRPVDWSR